MARGMSSPGVALNGRFTGTPQPTGTQTAAFHLFDAIIRCERDIPLVVFADPRFPGATEWAKQPQTTLVPVPFQDWSRGRAQLWEQLVLPLLCHRHGCQLAHHPITTNPWLRLGIRKIVTVHDLNFCLHPEWVTWSFRTTYRFVAIPGICNADQIVTISDYVADKVHNHLKIPLDRLHRIYNGVKPLPAATAASLPRPPYLLCVGSLQPHKNLARLIRAYSQIRAEFPDHELWIVGRPQPHFRDQPELTQLLQQPGVRVLGYLSEGDLGEAYRQARLFCYPSLEEGFGLPMLEAMIAGTLVVASNVSCLPEIAGPAAELVDPLSVESLAGGMRALLKLGDGPRQQRVESGRKWALGFTWQTAAKQYVELYRRLLPCN